MNKFYKFPYLYPTLTFLLGGLPFAIYIIERKLGILPSSETWYATGTNHGPWRGSIEEFTIYYPLVILAIATLIIFISRGSKEKKTNLIFAGILLAVVQIGVLIAQMYFLTWTID